MPTSLALPANLFDKRDPSDIGDFPFWDPHSATVIDFIDLVAPTSKSVSKRVVLDTGKVPFWDLYSDMLIVATVPFIGYLLLHCVIRALRLHTMLPVIVAILAGWAIWSMQSVYPRSSSLLGKTLRNLISLSFRGTLVMLFMIFPLYVVDMLANECSPESDMDMKHMNLKLLDEETSLTMIPYDVFYQQRAYLLLEPQQHTCADIAQVQNRLRCWNHVQSR